MESPPFLGQMSYGRCFRATDSLLTGLKKLLLRD